MLLKSIINNKSYISKNILNNKNKKILFHTTRVIKTNKIIMSALKENDDKKIDGTAIAKQIRLELKQTCDDLKATANVIPGLAVILIGERHDSATYVRMKKKACEEVGINSIGIDYPIDVTQDEVIAKIDELNLDPSVNGILVQLPIPQHLDEGYILNRITPDKDVDGLHPLNVAKLANTKTHAPGKSVWSFDSVDFHVSCTYLFIISI